MGTPRPRPKPRNRAAAPPPAAIAAVAAVSAAVAPAIGGRRAAAFWGGGGQTPKGRLESRGGSCRASSRSRVFRLRAQASEFLFDRAMDDGLSATHGDEWWRVGERPKEHRVPPRPHRMRNAMGEAGDGRGGGVGGGSIDMSAFAAPRGVYSTPSALGADGDSLVRATVGARSG